MSISTSTGRQCIQPNSIFQKATRKIESDLWSITDWKVIFLVAKQLYMWLCRSVCWSVCYQLVFFSAFWPTRSNGVMYTSLLPISQDEPSCFHLLRRIITKKRKMWWFILSSRFFILILTSCWRHVIVVTSRLYITDKFFLKQCKDVIFNPWYLW